MRGNGAGAHVRARNFAEVLELPPRRVEALLVTTTRYRCTVCGAVRATLESAQAHVAKKHAHGEAGLVDRRTTRSGVPVALYDGEASGMDTGGGRWQTVCERHGWIISHTTKALAFRFLPVPEEWCEKCAGTEPSDD